MSYCKELVGAFFRASIIQYELWWCSLHRRGQSATRGRTVLDLKQGLGFPV
jgi:hypothetical protein